MILITNLKIIARQKILDVRLMANTSNTKVMEIKLINRNIP